MLLKSSVHCSCRLLPWAIAHFATRLTVTVHRWLWQCILHMYSCKWTLPKDIIKFFHKLHLLRSLSHAHVSKLKLRMLFAAPILLQNSRRFITVISTYVIVKKSPVAFAPGARLFLKQPRTYSTKLTASEAVLFSKLILYIIAIKLC